MRASSSSRTSLQFSFEYSQGTAMIVLKSRRMAISLLIRRGGWPAGPRLYTALVDVQKEDPMTGTLQRRSSYVSDDSEPVRIHELSSHSAHSAEKIRERAQFGCQKYCGPPLRKMIEKNGNRRKSSSLHLIGLFASGLCRINFGWSETLASPSRACTEVTDAFLRPITNLRSPQNDRQPRHLVLLNSMGAVMGASVRPTLCAGAP